METNERRRRTDAWFIRPVKLSFIILTIIFFVVLLGFGKLLVDVRNNSHRIDGLVAQNSFRIKEIQKSRIESCKRTYLGVREVFLPFFPPPPRTNKEQANLDKFNRNVHKLVAACAKQTTPKSLRKAAN